MVPWIAVTAASLLVWPLGGDDPLESTFPQEANGDIPFQADVVLFQEGEALAPEVTIAIPREYLGDRQVSDSLHVRVAVEMLDSGGEARVRYETELALQPDSAAGTASTFPVPERWLRLHPRWFEGTEGMRIVVEDVTRQKLGLFDRLRGEHPQGTVAGQVPWPRGEEESSLRISGIFFAWAQAEGASPSGAGLRSLRARLQPNPFRYYGAFQPVLTAYWERYGGSEPEGRPVRLVYEVVSVSDGQVVVRAEDPSTLAAEARWELKRFDVSRLPSGTYRLDVRIEDAAPEDDGSVFAATGGFFQVVWERQRWTQNEETLLAYARLLLSPADYDSLILMDRGAQEEFLHRFWDERAPTPRGEQNPLEAEFLRRIAEADRDYGTRFRRGFQTARGRVYIRLGEPDEISFNLNPQDRETLAYILPEEIEDPTEDAETRLRRTKRRTVRDNRAWEIWEYTVQGEPLIPEYTGMATGLKFIFVDELGYGDYTLVYTNVPGGLY